MRRPSPRGRRPAPLPYRSADPGERGFALLAVLLVMTLLAVIGTEFAYSMRLEASMVRAYRDSVIAANLAEAGVEQAIREILSQSLLVGTPEGGPLTFYRTALEPLPLLPRTVVPLGPGQFSYRITDEESRIDLNGSPPTRIDALLTVLRVEKVDRDTIVDSLQDWQDGDEVHRLNGAESEDTYLKLPLPYRSRNGPLEDVRELLQIHGMTPAIYYGHDRIPPLVDFVTVNGGTQVNINTASETVLRALGLSDAEVSEVIQTRRAVPYTLVPGKLAGRNLGTATQTFRIEADGLVAGEPRAHVTAIVRRQPDGQDHDFTVLGWYPNPPAAAGSSPSDH
jgi:general secretion pathway protein K